MFWKLQSSLWSSGLTKKKLIIIVSSMTSGVVITGLAQPSVHKAIATQSQEFGKILQNNFFKHNPQANGQQNNNGQGEDFWEALKKKLCWSTVEGKVKSFEIRQIREGVSEGVRQIKGSLKNIGEPSGWNGKIKEGWEQISQKLQNCNQQQQQLQKK